MPENARNDINKVKHLQDTVRRNLRKSNAHADNRLCLSESPKNARFIDKVLSVFNHLHWDQLTQETRMLSEGAIHTGNTAIPASYQKEVIRESLSDLRILELVNTTAEYTTAPSVSIPYEIRPSAAAIPNEGIVYEGQGIPFSGAGLESDMAHLCPMKLAIRLTDEVIHFSESSGVNWNAWGENISSNARIIGELIHLRITNEMVRASDSYGAEPVGDESFTASDSGLIKTVKFPVVRPFQARNLKGREVGNPVCPMNIIIGGNQIPYYTGAASLMPGTYWKFQNTNLGYIQLIDQDGEPTGENATGTISYYHATNLIKFDLNHADDVGYRKHLNYLLDAVGDQSAMLKSHRFSQPEYAVMSSMLNNEASKADQFAVWQHRNGTATTLEGDLDAIKSLPAFDTNAPGSDLGDQRILIGQRGLTSYNIAKPFEFGAPFEATDDRGRPIGQKVSYGTEFSAIHTPAAICNRYTSVLVYDSTKR